MDQTTATIVAAVIAAAASVTVALLARLKRSHAVLVAGVFLVVAVAVATAVYYRGDRMVARQEDRIRWDGTWQHSTASKEGNLSGELYLTSTPQSVVSGTYSYTTPNGHVRGDVTGEITNHGRVVRGRWRNQWNQNGRFYWEMAADGQSFEGRYSMSAEEPTADSGNSWRGSRR